MTIGALASTGLLLCCLVACRQGEAPKPQNSQVVATAQKREDEFRLKERCAMAAERLDKLFATLPGSRSGPESSLSEAFYSSVRNSCVCEVSTVGKGGKTGITTMLTLYDCLTREDLGTTLINVGGLDSDKRMDEWKRKKDALK